MRETERNNGESGKVYSGGDGRESPLADISIVVLSKQHLYSNYTCFTGVRAFHALLMSSLRIVLYDPLVSFCTRFSRVLPYRWRKASLIAFILAGFQDARTTLYTHIDIPSQHFSSKHTGMINIRKFILGHIPINQRFVIRAHTSHRFF